MCFEITDLLGIDGKLFLKQPQSKFYQMAEEKKKQHYQNSWKNEQILFSKVIYARDCLVSKILSLWRH